MFASTPRVTLSSLTALCCTVAIGATGNVSAAAEAEAASEGVAEIVVTATKRGDTNVQETPIAVQAISGQSLQDIGAVQVSDYVALVPGFTFQDNGPGDKRYAIRGVSSTGAGTVGVYLDDVVITGENSQDGGGQQPDVMLFDMQRIEVLKGPQGTTFGSSSMTGTLRFITNKPSLIDFGGSFRAGVIDTTEGGVGSQMDAMVNLPIVSDRFAIRLAGFYLDEPGFVSNQFEKNANETRVKAGRVSAKLAITDSLTLNGMVMLQETAADALGFYNTVDYTGAPIGQHFFQADLARGPTSNRMGMDNLALEYRTGFGTFTATASRLERSFHYTRDSSLALDAFLGLDMFGAGRSVIDYPKTRTVNSYEARFVSGWDSPFQLLAGVFDQQEIRNFRSHVLTADPNGYVQADPTVLLNRTVHDDLRQQAVFAEISYAFTDQLKLTMGGRYYDNKVREDSVAITNFGGGPGSGPGPTDRSTDVGFIGRFNLSYELTPDMLTYVEIAQGFRSGGVNDQTAASIAGVTIPAGFGSDSLINYELGAKTSWLDHRIIANGAVYFINWSKIQIAEQASAGTSSFPYTGNGGRATVKGVEFELDTAPVTGLHLGLYGNYNKAELAVNSPIPSQGLAGDPLPYVPQTTVSFNGDYNWALPWNELTATVGVTEAYISSRQSELRSDSPTLFRYPAYATTNLRAGIKKDNWEAMLNVQNVFDDTTTIADTQVVLGLYPPAQIPNRPRTMTLSVSAHF
jgi:iron complex outermembrane receptor protein